MTFIINWIYEYFSCLFRWCITGMLGCSDKQCISRCPWCWIQWGPWERLEPQAKILSHPYLWPLASPTLHYRSKLLDLVPLVLFASHKSVWEPSSLISLLKDLIHCSLESPRVSVVKLAGRKVLAAGFSSTNLTLVFPLRSLIFKSSRQCFSFFSVHVFGSDWIR